MHRISLLNLQLVRHLPMDYALPFIEPIEVVAQSGLHAPLLVRVHVYGAHVELVLDAIGVVLAHVLLFIFKLGQGGIVFWFF